MDLNNSTKTTTTTPSAPALNIPIPGEPMQKLLASVTCGELVIKAVPMRERPKVPVCLDVELTVQEGCTALATNKISSAPIYSSEAGGFLGMLDYRDLVAYVLEVFHKVPKEPASFDAEMEVSDIVKRAQQDRQGVPIKLVSNLSHRNPLIAVYSDAPLTDAVEQFVSAKAHRVVVLERVQSNEPGAPEPPSKFIGVLSQSAVAALVAARFGRLGNEKHLAPEGGWEIGNKSLGELGLVKGEVYSVATTDTVLDALYLMHSKSVSSVAIVDRLAQSPSLAGSISMTDIKEILATRGGWRRLYEPAFRFFATLRNQQGLEAGGSDRVPSFTVHPTTILSVAVEKMAATHTHRVWILADDSGSYGTGGVAAGGLVGVLSLSDVMPLLVGKVEAAPVAGEGEAAAV
ncbi:cell separation during budding [Blyttiomyces sp. JEL0837]|nr:cell separation during budding [Blyttiomyces sp. JEL0837]